MALQYTVWTITRFHVVIILVADIVLMRMLLIGQDSSQLFHQPRNNNVVSRGISLTDELDSTMINYPEPDIASTKQAALLNYHMSEANIP
jgi:hypothetical protein